MADDAYNVAEDYGQHVRVDAFYDLSLVELDAQIATAAILCGGVDRIIGLLPEGVTGSPNASVARSDAAAPSVTPREAWPIHQPGPAYEAPIPGVHWYGGCEPGYPRVNPATGICEGCGERACATCGREACPDHSERAA